MDLERQVPMGSVGGVFCTFGRFECAGKSKLPHSCGENAYAFLYMCSKCHFQHELRMCENCIYASDEVMDKCTNETAI